MAKKEEKRPTIRARVAEKFSRHEDEPEEMATGSRSKVSGPEVETLPVPPATYSVGAGAPPDKRKALQATIERDRKELKKKQKPPTP